MKIKDFLIKYPSFKFITPEMLSIYPDILDTDIIDTVNDCIEFEHTELSLISEDFTEEDIHKRIKYLLLKNHTKYKTLRDALNKIKVDLSNTHKVLSESIVDSVTDKTGTVSTLGSNTTTNNLTDKTTNNLSDKTVNNLTNKTTNNLTDKTENNLTNKTTNNLTDTVKDTEYYLEDKEHTSITSSKPFDSNEFTEVSKTVDTSKSTLEPSGLSKDKRDLDSKTEHKGDSTVTDTGDSTVTHSGDSTVTDTGDSTVTHSGESTVLHSGDSKLDTNNTVTNNLKDSLLTDTTGTTTEYVLNEHIEGLKKAIEFYTLNYIDILVYDITELITYSLYLD